MHPPTLMPSSFLMLHQATIEALKLSEVCAAQNAADTFSTAWVRRSVGVHKPMVVFHVSDGESEQLSGVALGEISKMHAQGACQPANEQYTVRCRELLGPL